MRKITFLLSELQAACNRMIANRKCFDVAAQNRKDIIRELNQCYSIPEIKKLETILGLCASDFETWQLISIIKQIHDRIDLLTFIENNIEERKYSTAEVQSLYKKANENECFTIRAFLLMHKDQYSANQQVLFANMHVRRMEELHDAIYNIIEER